MYVAQKLLAYSVIITLCILSAPKTVEAEPLSLDKWTYIEVDSCRAKWGDWDQPGWMKYFGLDMADVTGIPLAPAPL